MQPEGLRQIIGALLIAFDVTGKVGQSLVQQGDQVYFGAVEVYAQLNLKPALRVVVRAQAALQLVRLHHWQIEALIHFNLPAFGVELW